MGEEASKPATAETVVTEEVVVVADVPPPSQPQPQPPPECEKKPEPDPDAAENPKKEEKKEEKVEEEPKAAAAGEEVKEKITESASFKEETNVVGDLPESQKKALDELKTLIQEALNKRQFYAPPPAKEEEKKEEKKVEEEEKKEEVKVEVKEEKKESEAKPETEEAAKPAEGTEPCKEEAGKPEPEPVVEKTAPAPQPPPPAESEAAVVEVEKVVEKASAVDDDGAVTVEEIKETIVEVSTKTEEAASATTEVEPEAAKKSEVEEADKEEVTKVEEEVVPEEVFIYGIPLLGDEKSDVILLKFLRAREFKVKEAFNMIKNTVRWRKEFDIDAVLEEELGNDLEKAVFMHGLDKEGHPVCYNVYGEFQNKELYQACFTDDEKRKKFLKWRIQFLEKSVRKLDYSPTGICTIVHVNDMKNLPGLFQRDLRQSVNKALQLLQDNYPEFVAKQVCINVPWWYWVYHKMISPFLTQRTKSKFVFATPARSVDTLFKYIAPEHVPVQYGGLSREGEQEFSVAESVTEVTVKPASKHTVEFPVTEACVVVWEARVLGWDVCYGAEFVPSAEGSYTVIVQKSRRIAPTDEPIVSGSFKITEPGKVVLTIDNQTSKKKKLLCRSKTKPSIEAESLIDC